MNRDRGEWDNLFEEGLEAGRDDLEFLKVLSGCLETKTNHNHRHWQPRSWLPLQVSRYLMPSLDGSRTGLAVATRPVLVTTFGTG